MTIKALCFDVFGTVVDWRGSVAREAEAALDRKGWALDWGAFADGWRARYQPAMAPVRSGARPFVVLDELHRESLVALLAEQAVTGLSEPEIDDLNRAWWRLDPWPDVADGLARLRRNFIVATLSNGGVALMVSLSKRAGLTWDAILGAEIARAYKPSPEAYDRSAQALALAPHECLMVAAHASDLSAAAERGFRTAYVYRPLEYGGGAERKRPAGPFDICVDGLGELADVLSARGEAGAAVQ